MENTLDSKPDRIIYWVSVIYIALPVFLFLAGWLRPLVAIPLCLVFLISTFFLLKNRPLPIAWRLTRSQIGICIGALLILALWVFFSGLGGFAFQNSDYHYRNAILRDLIEKPWPVVYDFGGQSGTNALGVSATAALTDKALLIYYIAYWLPAAAVGKLMGWYAANAFLYFWSLLGMCLITYYIFRTLRSAKIRSVLLLVVFSGLDLIGYLIISKGQFPGLTAHIEWWSGYQYSSNTTLLFWVFNQSIVIWLAILLILQLKNSRSLFFLYSLLLLHGPFPFLGMMPVVLWKAYEGYAVKSRFVSDHWRKNVGIFFTWLWEGIRRALTFENLLGGIPVLVVSYLYLANNTSGGRMGKNYMLPTFFLFFMLEAGIYFILLFKDHHKKLLYWIALFSLIIIPYFQVGGSQDFCMRVSIPGLFIIQILIQKTLFGKGDTLVASVTSATHNPASYGSDKGTTSAKSLRHLWGGRVIKILLVISIILGSMVPFQEISRSIIYTLPSYPITHNAMVNLGSSWEKSNNSVLSSWGSSILTQSNNGMLWADLVITLGNNKETSANFTGPIDGNFFYHYLAARGSDSEES